MMGGAVVPCALSAPPSFFARFLVAHALVFPRVTAEPCAGVRR